MPQPKKHNWISIAIGVLLSIALIFLIITIFKGCNDPAPTHEDEAVKVTGLWEAQKQEFDKLSQKIDYFGAKDSAEVAKQIDNLRAEMLTAIKVGLAQKQSTVLVKQYEVAKINRDTAGQLSTCDSIIPKYISMGELLTEQQLNHNQQRLVYEQQIANRDSLQAATFSTYMGMKRSFDTVSTAYKGLYTDYTKQRKKAARNRTVGRITAATTVVLGGLLYLKK